MAYSTSAGSGVPNVGAPDCIEIEEAKLPKITGAPGFTSCVSAMPASASARVCADGAGHRHRRHRAGQNERRDDRGLVGARVDLERPEHG